MGEAQKGLPSMKRVRLGSYEDAGFLVVRDARSLRELKRKQSTIYTAETSVQHSQSRPNWIMNNFLY